MVVKYILPSVFAICPGVCAQKPAMNYLLLVLVNSPNSLCISVLKRFRLCRTILTGDQRSRMTLGWEYIR
jgi:hypothetical protein